VVVVFPATSQTSPPLQEPFLEDGPLKNILKGDFYSLTELAPVFNPHRRKAFFVSFYVLDFNLD